MLRHIVGVKRHFHDCHILMKHLISASPAPDWNYYLKKSRVKQGAFKQRKVMGKMTMERGEKNG